MDIKERLTHKLGPLPVWAWMGLAGGAAGLLLMRGKGSMSSGDSFSNSAGGSRGAGAPAPLLPIAGSNLPIVDDPYGIITFPANEGFVSKPRAAAPTGSQLVPGEGFGGTRLALTNNLDGTKNLVKIGTQGDTQALPFENLVNPLLNPLINLLNKIDPLTGISPLAAQSAKEASQVAPGQVGTGVPVGFHADGSPILIYFKNANPYAPVLTTPSVPLPNVIATSPTSAPAPQIPAASSQPIWSIPGVDAMGNSGYWSAGDANTAPSFHPA